MKKKKKLLNKKLKNGTQANFKSRVILRASTTENV